MPRDTYKYRHLTPCLLCRQENAAPLCVSCTRLTFPRALNASCSDYCAIPGCERCAEHSACILWKTQRAAGHIGITDYAHGKAMRSPCSAGRRTGTAQPGQPLPTAIRLAASHSPGPGPATSLGILQTAVGRTGIDISSNRTAMKLAHTQQGFPQVHLTFVTQQ